MDTIINTKKTILVGLKTEIASVVDWVKNQADEHFEYAPAEKWTTGQHVDHLLKSTQPLNFALVLPKTALKDRFGSLNRAAKSYVETLEWYESELAKGRLQAMGKFVPAVIGLDQKQELLQTFLDEGEKLIAILEKWSENELDNYCIPHPLLGNMTVREILFFTVFHTLHHCNSLKANYPSA